MARKKKRKSVGYTEVELNLMPFIDTFSILVTFLLMSAVFVTLGIIEVQIPFLAPPSKDMENPPRVLDVKVDMEKDQIEVIAEYTRPPENRRSEKFPVTKQGIDDLHRYLVQIRQSEPEADKVSFFIEDDVLWKDIAEVLDAIKLRRDGDPVFPLKDATTKDEISQANQYLFPKVVFSSVIL